MTASCHRSAHLDYCDALPAIIDHFAAVAGKIDPETPVPTTPGWSVADLVQHTGGIHRWARAMVAELMQERLSGKNVTLNLPENKSDLPGWLADGAGALVDTFRSADPDAAMWAWGSDKHARFWSRRMIHETAVHAADAEFAAGSEPAIDPVVATDGIDEFLDNLPHAEYFAPRVAELRGSGETVVLQDPEGGTVWSIRLDADRFAWDHSETEASVLVTAAPSDLLLFAYGRRKVDDERIAYEGDRPLLDFWVERSSI
jgi:uncharacterized protein (TIGR03083 family)